MSHDNDNENEVGETDDTATSFNRRQIVKALGATGTFTGLGATGIANAAAESSGTSIDVSVSTVSGDGLKEVIETAKSLSEFNRLRNYVSTNDLGSVKANPGHASGWVAQGKNEKGIFVSFDVENSTYDRAKIVLGWNGDGSVITSGAEFTNYTKTTSRAQSEAASVPSSAASRSEKVPATVVTIDGKQGMKKRVSHPHQAASEAVSNSRSTKSGTVTASSIDLPSAPCDACHAVTDFICQVGCGTPFWILCGLIGVGTIDLGAVGGIACIDFVSVVCAAISLTGCGPALNQTICQQKYNVC